MARKKTESKVVKAKELQRESKSRHEAILQAKTIVALAPSYNASAIVADFTSVTVGEIEFMAAGKEIAKRCADVIGNKTGRMEEMLMAQAHSLDVMFASLSRRAAANMGQGEGRFLNAADMYLKLALRAQNQCRMTLETLATIKNPPVVFAKQANIANNQQVNNGEAVPVACAGETGNQPNEQSRIGHDKGQSLDGGTLQGAIGGCPPLEAVAAGDRAQDRKG